MKEDMINNLRQQDNNLREAIRQEEVARPHKAVDLNARLMTRVAEEQKPRRMTWYWVAAACAAVVIAVTLMPPRITDDASAPVVAQKTEPKADDVKENLRPQEAEPQVADITTKAVDVRRAAIDEAHESVVHRMDEPHELVAQATATAENNKTETVQDTPQEVAMADVQDADARAVVLTESDLPITRPENYRYTPEEIALMKKQANEAYIKWVELELEIAKFNLEHTAQNK